MAYPAPAGLSETQLRDNIILLDQALYTLWNLGDNLLFGWTPAPRGLRAIVAPHPMLTEFALGDGNLPPAELTRRARLLDKLLSNQEHLEGAAFDEVSAALGVAPRFIELPFAPEQGLGLPLIAAIAARYGVRLVEDRAVILFDAVGFSLLTPLQQVVQLNSLSCSVNAAYAKLLAQEININFARTTTGDGFYIWNRMRGVEANVELYQLMQFILADNALAQERATRPESVPKLRACFHVGSHYEFYQSEGLNPTSFSYLVGQVTIELARMVENARPGQILVGKFNTLMHDETTGDDVRIDSLDFVERTRAPLRSLNGLKLAGSEVDEIACYLTGRRDETGLWGISEYQIADKHGLIHRVYNAKINIHRRNGEPIYLGLREEDLPPDAPRTVADTDFHPLPT
ncbi:hypothetical protein [Roseateles sp. LYH14W]|uniref:Uncharacterized protein n=1 Tax=Pelomonas parva TaxID=3299032 RepID=A0ABW7F5C5_9BURK